MAKRNEKEFIGLVIDGNTRSLAASMQKHSDILDSFPPADMPPTSEELLSRRGFLDKSLSRAKKYAGAAALAGAGTVAANHIISAKGYEKPLFEGSEEQNQDTPREGMDDNGDELYRRLHQQQAQREQNAQSPTETRYDNEYENFMHRYENIMHRQSRELDQLNVKMHNGLYTYDVVKRDAGIALGTAVSLIPLAVKSILEIGKIDYIDTQHSVRAAFEEDNRDRELNERTMPLNVSALLHATALLSQERDQNRGVSSTR